MYFDVDHIVHLSANPTDDVFAYPVREIERRRGSIVSGSAEALTFSAPFFRVHAPSFLVPQLPFGVSQGVLQIVETTPSTVAVRCRLSFTWLRVLMSVLLFLMLSSAITGSSRGSHWFWLVVAGGILGTGVVYWIALLGARRFLQTKLFRPGTCSVPTA